MAGSFAKYLCLLVSALMFVVSGCERDDNTSGWTFRNDSQQTVTVEYTFYEYPSSSSIRSFNLLPGESRMIPAENSANTIYYDHSPADRVKAVDETNTRTVFLDR